MDSADLRYPSASVRSSIAAENAWFSNAAGRVGASTEAASVGPKASQIIHPDGPFMSILSRLNAGDRDMDLNDHENHIEPILQAMCRTEPCFTPLDNLLKPLSWICAAVRSMISATERSNCLLLSGPKGIGKTMLLKSLTNRVVLGSFPVANRPALPTASRIAVYTRLGNHKKQITSTFCQWLLGCVATQLDECEADLQIRQYVRQLHAVSQQFRCPTAEQLRQSGLLKLNVNPSTAAAGGRASARPAPFCVQAPVPQFDAANETLITLLNRAIRIAGVSVLIIVDETEHLFKKGHFSDEAASDWQTDMHEVAVLTRSALGLVMCSSFERTRQLLFGEGRVHNLPKAYKQPALAKNWNATKVMLLRMRPPRWTASKLAEFILLHSLSAKSAIDRAQQAKEAARLDRVFFHGTLHSSSQAATLDEVMDVFLAQYGHNPRLIFDNIMAGVLHLEAPCILPGPLVRPDDLKASCAQMKLDAKCAFGSYVQVLKATKPDVSRSAIKQLEYDEATFTLSKASVENQIRQRLSESCGAAGVSAEQHPETLQPSASTSTCLNAAIDLGLLVEVSLTEVAACDASTFLSFVCARDVSPTLLTGMRHVGYGEQAKLCVARALARAKFLLRVRATVLTGSDARASNSDSSAGSLSSLHLVALAQTGSLIDTRSVRLEDMAELRSHFQLPTALHAAAWASIVSAAASQGYSARAVAALCGAQRTSEATLNALRKVGASVWLKESPNSAGGDLVGIQVTQNGTRLDVDINRVQVKLASQAALLQGPGSQASHGSIETALCEFYGVDSSAKIGPSDIPYKHTAACEAIADMILAAAVNVKTSNVGEWLANFKKLSTQRSVRFHFKQPAIATTHVPSPAVRNQVDQARVSLIDGQQLLPFWGPLGAVCGEFEVLLAPVGDFSGEDVQVSSAETSPRTFFTSIEDFLESQAENNEGAPPTATRTGGQKRSRRTQGSAQQAMPAVSAATMSTRKSARISAEACHASA